VQQILLLLERRPTSLLVKEVAPFPNINGLGTNINSIMDPDGALNQK
jgi:hypothetical protein